MSKPFRSKFIPYVDQIKAWRRAGKTWKEVAGALTAVGVKADAGNVCRVMARIKRRPYPLGAEPEPQNIPTIRPAHTLVSLSAETLEEDIYDQAREATLRAEQRTSQMRVNRIDTPRIL